MPTLYVMGLLCGVPGQIQTHLVFGVPSYRAGRVENVV